MEKGANVEAEEIHGQRPLHLASINGHLEIVTHLLKKGANPGAKDKEGLSPLQKSRNEEICTLLKESMRGEDSNLRSLKRKFDSTHDIGGKKSKWFWNPLQTTWENEESITSENT